MDDRMSISKVCMIGILNGEMIMSEKKYLFKGTTENFPELKRYMSHSQTEGAQQIPGKKIKHRSMYSEMWNAKDKERNYLRKTTN